MASSSLFFILLLLTPHLTCSNENENKKPIDQHKDALINFIKSVRKIPYTNWNDGTHVCNWTGILCYATNTEYFGVMSLSLPAQDLKGKIPEGSLGNIKTLKVLSLHSNLLSGPLPEDFAYLHQLRNVFLFNNNFSGPFPSSTVSKWKNLLQLDMSNNSFTGTISNDINNLVRLQRLKLQNNKLDGWLPNELPSTLDLKNFSVSNNNLSGPVPKSLLRFPKEAFTGNVYLCDERLPSCNQSSLPPAPPPPPGTSDSLESAPNNKKKLSTGAIVAIAIGSPLLILILLSCMRKKRSQEDKEKKPTSVATTVAADVPAARAGRGCWGGGEAGTSSSKDDAPGAAAEGERNKLVFFEGGVYSFGLEELLRASTELLGKGSVGKSYKLVLKEGITVVGKRLKDIDVSKKDFADVMERLGKMKNENVVSIRAYYYSEDEKLLVCDYFPAGSLSALLHGSRGSGRTHLDWDHRLRIALSAAKGVAYLHVAGEVIHGNIKSSNILLRQDSKKDASVSDFGLNTLFGGSSSSNTLVTGYRAPEFLKTQKVTFESDVYSFGVLLLELLTGKAPDKASLGEEGTDLPKWANSRIQEKWTVREKWKAEVFDAELMRYQNIEEEMVQLLQIAMKCVSTDPGKRPAMQEVVRKMEDMNRAETDDGIV